jgi:hypothetical protein
MLRPPLDAHDGKSSLKNCFDNPKSSPAHPSGAFLFCDRLGQLDRKALDLALGLVVFWME